MLRELDQHKRLNKGFHIPKFRLFGVSTSSIMMTLAISATGMSSALADDTEIFTAGVPTSAATPNVVFVIDTSGSMGNPVQNDPSGTSKIQMVKDVFEQLIFDPNNLAGHNAVNPATQGMNFALMRFDDGSGNDGNANGGYFLTRMRTLNNGSKDYFWDPVSTLDAGGYTPLAEAAYEASRYFRGEAPLFGAVSNPATNDTSILAGGNYKSPFSNNETQCGINNHLVILTDGLPTRDGDADTQINGLANTTSDCTFSEASNTDCLPQVAEHLYSTDLFDDIPGDQKVMTHTIAFDLSDSNAAINLLRQTAENGGGIAARANNASELADAIAGILAELPEAAMSFVSPATSVSSSNRFVHDNNVYFGLFKPEMTPLWNGNLKGYQLNSNGELMDFTTPPQSAVNADGSFASNARSKWSSAIDGSNIEQGGAAERILAQASRSIFTQNSTTPTNSTLVNFSVANETNLPVADFGAGVTNDEKIEIIQWATSRAENPIGDPLHSNPQIVNFGGDTGPVIFFGTNQGFLHAISATTGQELMAFIPKSLLSNLKTFRDNNSNADHPYGLDGHISVYRNDSNGDGEIDATDGDTVLLVIGMRRGGNDFIALNVTNLNAPTLAWQLTGGDGNFAAMGQSWSKPIITEMNFGAALSPTREKVVLIGGGYDTQYDELDNTISNPAGAAIYAVKLSDGSCVWSVSSSSTGCTDELTISELTHSIPSHISAIDLTSDGVVDRLYAIDVMGQLFRIDLSTLDSGGTDYQPSGLRFADLSGADRRFYYGVDVAYTNTGFTPKLHLSVGSGHRAHPLAANSADIFFSVWDTYINYPIPAGFSTITTGSLANLSSLATELTETDTNGWYFSVPEGEKVLSLAASLSGYVFFTTYAPPTEVVSDSCTVQFGSGYVYAVSLGDASALSSARAIPVNSTGIPSEVAFMTLSQPESENNTSTENPLASQDTEVFVMVNGLKVDLTEEEQRKVNKATESTKSYWYIQQ